MSRVPAASRPARRFVTALLVPLASLAASGARAAEADRTHQASAQLEPGLAGLDELVTFAITVESPGFSGVQISPTFELDNLEIVAGPFQSRSQRWVNGQTSSSVQLTWRLRPLAVGSAAVRAIRIVAGERTIELADRRVEIQPQAPAGRASGRAPGEAPRRADPFDDLISRAFPELRSNRRGPAPPPKVRLQAEVTPAEPYVGQQATYTLWLYTQSDISAFQPTKIPDFRGFWVREVPQPQELRPEWVEVGGERFGRVPMLRRAIYPLQPGRFTLDPTEADIVARISDIGPFGSPFGRNESLHLKTEAVALTARPLPASPPGVAGLAIPVGEIALSARLDRQTLEVGQAATLTVRCTGRGHLQSLAPPSLELPAGLKGFPPQQESSERLNEGMLVASTEWSYVLVPERPGRYEIGGIEVPWFDPTQREFRIAAATPPPLAVTGTAVVAAVETVDPPGTVPTPDSTTGAAPAGESSRALWIWLGAGVPFALAGLGIARALRARFDAGRTQPARSLRTAIAGASAAATPRQAAAELEEAWRQYLAERWRIAPGTPVSSWTERLLGEKAEPAAARELAELAHELHYLRYAPELSAADQLLADALETSRRLARSLR